MDNNLKRFIQLSGILIVISFILAAVLGYIYRYFTIRIYNILITSLILVIFVFCLVIILSVVAVFFAYGKKRVRRPFAGVIKICMNILLPFLSFVSSLLRFNKDILRKIYIDVNNILVQSNELRFPPEQILLIVPHCLQKSDCSYKITRDIGNCKQCGKCCIGGIARLVEDTGIKAAVATGGTAARQEVEKSKPKIILSVACERDLASGISDIKKIPVLGVLNERPNGPCYNTYVDVEILKQKVYEHIHIDS